MSAGYYQRFQLAYAPFFVRKRVGKYFKVVARFRTYQEASDYFSLLSEQYPGIYFDIKDVSVSNLDKKSRV